MSLIQGTGGGLGGAGAPGGALGNFYSHLLDQSLKFNDSSNPLLKRTPASQGSLTTFTFSFWYKRCTFGTYQEVLHVYPGSGERSQILFMNDDTLKVELEAANTNHFITNMEFRDSSAWYNVVVTFDSTNGTEANRVKIYVNGVDQSDTANGGDGFSTANYPSQNATSGFNTTSQHEISTYDETDYHLDGYLAEVNFIDGTALTAASFGETKDGIWIPIDTSGLTFGTNGFHLTFKDDVVSEGFNSVTWRGTGAANSISGLGFQPDFVWIKDRTDAVVNYLTDSVRGADKEYYSDGGTNGNTDNALAEYTDTNTLTTFDADGFTVGTSTGTNGSADDMVAWCWEAGGPTPTETYKVVVDNDGANKYRFRNSANNATWGTYAPTITLQEGGTYVFDWSDDGTNGTVSAQGHPIRFSTTSDGTHNSGSEYTTGVVKDDSAHKTTITVAAGAPTLYYYCQIHSGMGGQINTNSTYGSTNFDGNILSTVSANTSKGFSIVNWTYSTSADNLVGHGLDSAPTFMILKSRTNVFNFDVYHSGLSAATKRLILNHNSAEQTGFFDTAPTSTVFEYNVSALNNGDNTMAYCWHDVSGYSKFGSFTGNGGSQEITVGFEPALVVIKRRDATSNWHVFDNTRNPANPRSSALNWDRPAAEATNAGMTFSSTGFNDNGWISDSGQEILYMAWADTREAAFFKDVSSNGNHWTPVNLDYRDSVPDTPTNNFCTFNKSAVDSSIGVTLSKGNLSVTPDASGGFEAAVASFTLPRTGKWYWEYRTGAGGSSIYGRPSIITVDEYLTQTSNAGEISGGSSASNPNGVLFTANDGGKRINNSDSSHGSAVSAGDIIGNAYNADTGQWYIYINNSIQASGAAISESIKGNLTGKDVYILHERYNGNGVDMYNFGQDSSFGGLVATANANADGNGYGSFAYAPPSGYLALCSQNLPNPAITDGTDHFEALKYNGNSSTQSISSLNFSPDFVWTKRRSASASHYLSDSVRGGHKVLFSEQDQGEYDSASNDDGVESFDSNGFTLKNGTYVNDYNASGSTYIAWNWLAGTAFSNSAGANGASIASSGQANTTAGFSIVSYTGTGSAGTIKHGLSVAPEFIMLKNRDASDAWRVYHSSVSTSDDKYLVLSGTNGLISGGSDKWNGQPTSTVFGVAGSDDSVNASGEDYISYIFHSVEGYSKVGSYIGNGNANGVFVHTGFRPAWVMIKQTSASGQWWGILDNARDPGNLMQQRLWANASDAESAYSTDEYDFLSNGFKLKGSYASINASGATYVYLAFAQSPFKFANAR
tara:strand:+ start:541 stop:4404 length:3864 start_codon:yes stop_codon:yes gene_type:complete